MKTLTKSSWGSTIACVTIALVVLAVAAKTVDAARNVNARVNASGYILHVNGKLFVIKGMNYSPVPIGVAPGDGPPVGVYGDYFVSNYANVWRPDIDKIRQAGVNVIKLYAGNPDLNAGAPGTAGN